MYPQPVREYCDYIKSALIEMDLDALQDWELFHQQLGSVLFAQWLDGEEFSVDSKQILNCYSIALTEETLDDLIAEGVVGEVDTVVFVPASTTQLKANLAKKIHPYPADSEKVGIRTLLLEAYSSLI